jgi:hypothetical protein
MHKPKINFKGAAYADDKKPMAAQSKFFTNTRD